VHWRLPRQDERTCAITFDDGPSAETPRVLEILRRHDVKATFFVLSSNARRHPEALRTLAANGHTIAVHGVSHHKLHRAAEPGRPFQVPYLYDMNYINGRLSGELQQIHIFAVRALFVEGEEVRGGKQNRILASSVLVAGRNRTRIPVACTEPGRWDYDSRHFTVGSCCPPSLRRLLKDGRQGDRR